MRVKKGRYGTQKLYEVIGGGFMVATGVALTAFGITAEVGIPLAIGGVAVLGDGLQSTGKEGEKSKEKEREEFRTLIKGAKV